MRYDSLLVHYLARELDERYHGRRIRSLRFDAESRALVLEFEEGALLFELHPERGWIREMSAPALGEPVRLSRQPRLVAVEAPPDDRLLDFRIAGAGAKHGRTRRLVVELMTNQWNALAIDGNDRVVAALWPRDAGDRRLRPSHAYVAPRPPQRAGTREPVSREEWDQVMESAEPDRRARTLVRELAWLSPLNAKAILDPPDEPVNADQAYARYRAMAARPDPLPGISDPDGKARPYPLPLPDRPHRRTDGLLEAIAAVAPAAAETSPAAPGRAGAEPRSAPAIEATTLRRLEKAVERGRARIEGMEEELSGAAEEAASIRARADVLLARLHEVGRGEKRVELPDFEGGTIEIELDPALGPVENANRMYEEAGKRDRAAERLPRLLRSARVEQEKREAVLDRVRSGEAGEEEVLAEIGPAPAPSSSGEPESLPPYRSYRTTGGLEVRVGRNRKANDELTFHNSSPDDIWLHARDNAGSHVILRWPHAESSPPPGDLAQAGVLAALNSRARTSSVVPVDWTRRKYVRKPRKSPPGLVLPDRVKTIFVKPDPAVERRLREGDGD